MSVYPAPTRNASIFNPTLFTSSSSSDTLTAAAANYIYAKLAGGQTIRAQETFQGGVLTNSIGPWSGTTVSVGDDLYVAGAITTPDNVTSSGTVTGSNISCSSISTTRAYFQRRANAVQTFTTGVTTLLLFQSLSESTGTSDLTYNAGVFTNSSTNTKWYVVTGYIAYAQISTSALQLWITKNSETVRRSHITADGPLSVNTRTFSTQFSLNAGETFRVNVVQTTGANLNTVNTASQICSIEVLVL